MPRYYNGWTKLYRPLLNTDIGQDLTLLGFLSFIILSATRFETHINWQGHPRRIPPGSFVFGYRELADRFKCSTNKIVRLVKYFQERGTISIESETCGSLITIQNYAQYQIGRDAEETPGIHDPLHQRDSNRELENKKSINNDSNSCQLTEIRFSKAKEIKQVESLLLDALEIKSLSPSLKNHVPAILHSMACNVESIADHIDQLLTSEKADPKKNPNARTYLEVSILKKFGILKEVSNG